MFNFIYSDPATTSIVTLSLHDALPIYVRPADGTDVHARKENCRHVESRRESPATVEARRVGRRVGPARARAADGGRPDAGTDGTRADRFGVRRERRRTPGSGADARGRDGAEAGDGQRCLRTVRVSARRAGPLRPEGRPRGFQAAP